MTDREAMLKAFEIIGVLKPENIEHKHLQGAAWDALRQALAQPEQEPVAWMDVGLDMAYSNSELDEEDKDILVPLYTAPPSKPWVGLHLDDIPETFVGDWSFLEGAKWAEAKLKEKNT